MKLVSKAYAFLKERGFLPSFGKCRNIVLEGQRDVTPAVIKASTGLDVSKLSPKKWGLSGSSSVVLVAFLAGTSILLSQGIDIRPNLAAILGLAFMDSIFLGGSCLALISSYWPPFKRRILVHEAGHLLTAYLMGVPRSWSYFGSNRCNADGHPRAGKLFAITVVSFKYLIR
ncbi:unnamed protein product [Rhodiola kirilowii]